MINTTPGMKRDLNLKSLAVFMTAIAMLCMPFTANALFENEVKLLASDGVAGDWFGSAVSISGDTAIAGSYIKDGGVGTAYIYVRDGNGVWTQQQKLLALDGVALDQFGSAVSISGDTALIGAIGDDDDGSLSGSAYVFVRDGNGVWTQQQKLLALDGAADTQLGTSVYINGDTAIIGSSMNDERGTDSGAAYVFVRVNGNWTQQQKLLASDSQANDRFGQSVSIDGDTAIVGANYKNSLAGAAYIYVRVNGVWTQQQKLLDSNGAALDRFGNSVSISGDTVIVGSMGDDDNGPNSGSAFVFVRVNGVWTQQQLLMASVGVNSGYFSSSVSIDGDMVIIGAYFAASGSAYVFARDVNGVWTQQQKLLASDGAAGDYFGKSVSISGDTVIAGAYRHDDNGNDSGSVYVYQDSGAAVAPDITITDSVVPASDRLVPFGDVTVSTTSTETVTVTNDGNADLVLGSVAQTNPLGAPFSILNDTCSGQTLAPAAGCTFDVRFSPTVELTLYDDLDIPSNDPVEGSVTVNVSGTGAGTPVPDITVTDTVAPVDDLDIPFGSVTEGLTSDQTVTVTNDGNADLVLGNVAAVDLLVSPFSILNDTCSSQTLAPAASCTFTVRFEPTTIGAFTDSFDIPSNDEDEDPVPVNVSGTGAPTPVPNIMVTDAITPADDRQIPFADLTVGGSSDQTVTVTNDGNADLVIGNVAQANALAAPFSVVNDNCSGQTVAAAANCTFDVRFAPTAAGTFNDSLDIPSDDPDENSVTVNVGGTGLAAGVNNPPDTPTLVFPADGQQGLPTTVALEWEPVTDPDGDTVSYDVYNCTDPDPVANCTSIAVAMLNRGADESGYRSAGLGYGGGAAILGLMLAGGMYGRRRVALVILAGILSVTFLASCHYEEDNNKTYTASGLDTGSTYYWVVVANDGNGGETPSAVWSYTTAP